MSIEANRPPKEAETRSGAESISPPGTLPVQVPASITPTGRAGARRKLGKTGPAKKGRTVAKRKPEKKGPAKKVVEKATTRTRAGKGSFREEPKTGWRTRERVGGRKPSAEQKSLTKKRGPAEKTVAKRATVARRAPAKKAPVMKGITRSPAAKKAAPRRPATKRGIGRR